LKARPPSRLPQHTESNSCEHNCSQGSHQLSVPATSEAHTAQVPHNVSQVELMLARRGVPSRYKRTALSVEHARSAMITRLTVWSSAVWTSDGDELEDREGHVDADDSSPSESEIWTLPLRVLSGVMSLHGLQGESWQAYEEACSLHHDQRPQHVRNIFC